jgi:hypothetical protein
MENNMKNFEIKYEPIVPVETEKTIWLNGRKIGTIVDHGENHPDFRVGNRFFVSLKIQPSGGSSPTSLAQGFGSTVELALVDAFERSRKEVESYLAALADLEQELKR